MNRYWLLDATKEEDTSGHNRLHEVEAAAQMPIVGLVDENGGGVIGYLHADLADEILSLLNRVTSI